MKNIIYILTSIFNIKPDQWQELPFGKGAIKQSPSKDIPKLGMGDFQPFDWSIGYDVRDVLKHRAGISEIPTKNQFSSGSCGGQSMAYLVGVLDALNDKIYREKSARFMYAPVAVPGGGSSEETLIDREMKIGCAEEKIVPSYINGITTEEWMTNKAFPSVASINALGAKGMTPVYLDPTDIEMLARAVRDYGGFIVGVDGEDNGTWLSEFPKPPRKRVWGHWVYIGQAKEINGKKMLALKNSWGNSVGQDGWQWIGEDYLAGHTWGAWTFILAKPEVTNYTFNNSMKLGDSSVDVKNLQIVLKQQGFLLPTQQITSYFGSLTFKAVKDFQTHYKLPSTGFAGSLTREVLNKITK